jgi:hypothetical protein
VCGLRARDVSIRGEARYIVERAQAHEACLVKLGALVFFSTKTGDAWMLDREDRLAICLARDGAELLFPSERRDTRFAIEWTGRFELYGDAFTYADNAGHIRTVLGYPVAEIRGAL